MRLLPATALALLFALPLTGLAQKPVEPTLPQMNQAKNWLELIDAGKFEQAWNEANADLRRQSLADWSAAIRKARRSEAAVKCRKGLDFELLEKPDRIDTVFITEFADGHVISEKVTLREDANGNAQVAGYRRGPPLQERGSPCDP